MKTHLINEENVMKKEEFKKLDIKIQEYIEYGIKIGIFNTENKDIILDKLGRTEIIYSKNKSYGGVTYNEGDKIIVEICIDKLEKEALEL